MLTVYQTDADGYLIGSQQADPDPLTPGAYLVPGGCVGTPPPSLAANECAHWSGGAWSKRPDHRGTVYWLADGSEHTVTERGVALPVGALTTKPPKPLATLKSEKIAQIDAAYNAAIQQDVTYMGTTFQADAASQDVLVKTLVTLNAAGATPPGFWWKDEANNQVTMTLAELNGLAMAMWAQGQVAFSHKDDLKAQVAAATTDAEVAAVTW